MVATIWIFNNHADILVAKKKYLKFETKSVMLLCKKQCRNPYVHGDLNARQYAFNPRRRSVRIDKGAGTERGRIARSAPFFSSPQKNTSRFIAERAGLTLLIHPASSFPCLFEREIRNNARQRAKLCSSGSTRRGSFNI